MIKLEINPLEDIPKNLSHLLGGRWKCSTKGNSWICDDGSRHLDAIRTADDGYRRVDYMLYGKRKREIVYFL